MKAQYILGILLKLALVGYGSAALAQQPVLEVVLHEGSSTSSNGSLLSSAQYSSIVVQLIGPFAGTVTFKTTNDNQNWNEVACTNRSSKAEATTATSEGTYVCPGGASLFRADFTRSSGTLRAIANATVAVTASAAGGGGGGGSFDGIIKDGAGDTTQVNVSNGRLQVENFNGNLAADNSTNSTAKVPVIVCVATAAAPSWTEGRQVPCSVDLSGRLRIRELSPCADHTRLTSAVIDESTAATNQIVALNGSDLIYVCGYKVVTTAANSLRWQYGTGTDCATGLTAIEGAQPYLAGGGVTEHGGGYPVFIVPAGNALCLTSSSATAHGGRVTYVRTAAP